MTWIKASAAPGMVNLAVTIRRKGAARGPFAAMSAQLSHVQLELAREPGHPYGDAEHVYHLYVPLDGSGQIDIDAFRRLHQVCRVRRKRPGESEARGRILHGPGGRWMFDYDEGSDRDNELAFRHHDERLIPGEYVSIREDDGRLHTFQVVAVRTEL